MRITRVGTFTLGWGESLVWDELRNRLYFADCAAGTLHWLDEGETTPATLPMPSFPTGVVVAEDGSLVVVLEDGLYRVDPDAGTCELISAYPGELGGRANDACADLEGNVITGKLNPGPGDGSAWQFSKQGEWTMLDDDIANTNGPAALVIDGKNTLIIGDTSAHYFAYDYDAATAEVGPRRTFGDVTELEGAPDGSTVDDDSGLWCALVSGGSQLVRFTAAGLTDTVGVPCANPTDVAFGGPDLDRLFVTSIGGDGDDDGALLAIDDLGFTGRTEPRARLGPTTHRVRTEVDDAVGTAAEPAD